MENNMLCELADLLTGLRGQRDEIEETEYQMTETMALIEIKNFMYKSHMYSLTNRLHASAVAGVKDELYAELKKRGFGDLVYETVNANSLSSFVKEQTLENNDALPNWLSGLVNIYDKNTISVRKA